MRNTRYLPAVACCLIIAFAACSASAAPGPHSRESGQAAAMPHKGMSMTEVERSFGQPGKVLSPVGTPPITRWIYEGYTVYFDHSYVIHAVEHARIASTDTTTAR